MRIGFVGDRGHSAVLKRITQDHDVKTEIRIFNPKRLSDDLYSETFSSLMDECDAVMIASPNDTHSAYLSQILESEYSGYVLCEKLPVSLVEDLKILERMNHEKTFYNFNLRHGILGSEIRSLIQCGDLGSPIHFSAELTHGLAFKKSSVNSWRFSGSGREILNTVGSHLLDFCAWSLDDSPSNVSAVWSSFSPLEKIDTVTIQGELSSGASINLISSYASCFSFAMRVILTDGRIEFDGNEIRVYGPRDTFDSSGLFTNPKQTQMIMIHDPFGESLRTSVFKFLNTVKSNGSFEEKDHRLSISTNSAILEC